MRSLSLPPLRGRSVRQDHRGAEDWRLRNQDLCPLRRCASLSKTHLVLPSSLPSSSFRVVQRSPLRRHHLRCPLPASAAASFLSRERSGAPRSLRRRAPQPSARSALVVFHHLDGLLHRRLAGLLHPAADPGVHRVSARRHLPMTVQRLLTDAIPSRAYPLTKPHPCHQGPLPSCRSRSASPSLGGTRRLQGLAPCKRPSHASSVAGGPCP